jgi:hypothetical protein
MRTFFSNVVRLGLLGAALAGPVIATARADIRHDEREIAHDRVKLRNDVRRHGRHSRQAAHDRAELQRDYARLQADRYHR